MAQGVTMSGKRRRFTKEFKAEVVKLVLHGGRGVPEVCREHGLGETSVYNWVKQARIDNGQGAAGALTSEEKGELSQLRKENRELRRERDFLTQATAFFARAKR
jgi:transposase